MHFKKLEPPRLFKVGNSVRFDMSDCGKVHLQNNEQITLTTENGGEMDVARKDWGFYATPSLNGRLEGFGLRAVLIHNVLTGRYFILVVERGYEGAFHSYLDQESCEIVCWLDSTEALDNLRSSFNVLS